MKKEWIITQLSNSSRSKSLIVSEAVSGLLVHTYVRFAYVDTASVGFVRRQQPSSCLYATAAANQL